MEVLAERERTHAYEIRRILKGVLGHRSVYPSLSIIEAQGYVTTE